MLMRLTLLLFGLIGLVAAAAWLVSTRIPLPVAISAEPEVTSSEIAQARPSPVETAVQRPRAAIPSPSMITSAAPPKPGEGGSELLTLAKQLSHSNYADQACLAGTANAAKPQATAIHRWTDASGIIHFSDQAPTAAARDYRRIESNDVPPIVVRARGYDVNLPDDLSRNAISSAQAIERVLRDSLGVSGDPGLVLDIEFIASAQTYAQRAGNPAMANSAGTYSTLGRTIHIRLQDDDESNFLILRHEITHALVHERIGRLPTAINEGLASYFEHIKVSGMGAQVAISESARSLASARIEGNGEGELIELLASDGLGFYGQGQEQRYLRAFGLVAMLMQTPPGRVALSAVLAEQRESPCVQVKAENILQAHYPGGLAVMATAWAAWMHNPPASVQAY